MPYYLGAAKRIGEVVLPSLPSDYQTSVLKRMQALGYGDPKADGSEAIEGVPNGYRVKCPDKNVEILYVVDEAFRHVWVFGVYLVRQ